MPRRPTKQNRSRSGGSGVPDRRIELLKSEIDLGFTFVAVALASQSAGNVDRARQAAKDARKKLRVAQKQMADLEMGRDERRLATERLKNLEQVLTTIEAKDPGVFSNHPAEEPAEVPRGLRDRKSGGDPRRSA
jgi:hypothetical protein